MQQSQIFISYSSLNRPFAVQIYNDLLSAGYWVWMDPKLKPAEKWEPQIEANLRKSETFVVLISSESIASDWVRHEGSMAFALNQDIVPVQIAPTFTGKLPIWVGKIQLHKLFEGSTDYNDKLQELKQLLGTPLPIRQHVEEMLFHYQNSGMLLEEVALALIEKHYHEFHFPKDKQILADKLIRESRAKLQDYWVRYGNLMQDYNRLQNDHLQVKDENEKFKNERILNHVLNIIIGLSLVIILILMYRYDILFK
jgi:hypothetical protein